MEKAGQGMWRLHGIKWFGSCRGLYQVTFLPKGLALLYKVFSLNNISASTSHQLNLERSVSGQSERCFLSSNGLTKWNLAVTWKDTVWHCFLGYRRGEMPALLYLLDLFVRDEMEQLKWKWQKNCIPVFLWTH